MVDLSNYNFKSLTVSLVKSEEYIINLYIDECLKSERTVSSNRRMRIILDTKYKQADLNKFMTKKCQRLNSIKLESLLNILKTINSCLMEI